MALGQDLQSQQCKRKFIIDPKELLLVLKDLVFETNHTIERDINNDLIYNNTGKINSAKNRNFQMNSLRKSAEQFLSGMLMKSLHF